MLESNLHKDVVDDFFHGRTVIGTTAAQVITPRLPSVLKGIQFKAGPANVGLVYIGQDGVTAGTAMATDGTPIAANEGFFLPAKDASKAYAIASAADQDLYWFVV
jgi:hypothetical protein